MNESPDFLKEAILDYLKRSKVYQPDGVDIVSHFGLHADSTLRALQELINENKVRREYVGIRCYYEIK